MMMMIAKTTYSFALFHNSPVKESLIERLQQLYDSQYYIVYILFFSADVFSDISVKDVCNVILACNYSSRLLEIVNLFTQLSLLLESLSMIVNFTIFSFIIVFFCLFVFLPQSSGVAEIKSTCLQMNCRNRSYCKSEVLIWDTLQWLQSGIRFVQSSLNS